MATHEVFNQPPPLEWYDVVAADQALLEGLTREGASGRLDEVHRLGRVAGEARWAKAAELANTHPPVLRTHDRYGNRIDEVEYHPAYHELMEVAVGEGLAGAVWVDDRPAPHVVRAAKFAVWTQVEAGHGCPVSMTYSIVPALRAQPDVAAVWEPLLTSRVYDPAPRPAVGIDGTQKGGAIAGMAMTEKQGGSDVRANTTRARRTAEGWSITGHKWFCSAPMSDVFLTLAHTDTGLSCFAMPRWLPDGTRNSITIQRLKDKLGNRSNASSEIELDGALASMVGEEGRGVATILTMVNHTRLDCVIGVVGQMRAGLSHAMHHAAHRSAFGRRLVDQPLMRNVLADLALESEAATVTMLRLAGAYDRAHVGDEDEAAFARMATAVAKYWVCKRAPEFAAEALECLGGAGYVEESPMPRLFRESPLNGIWEGSGNVICLDVLRAARRDPHSLEVFLDELASARGSDARYDRALSDLHAELGDGDHVEPRARRLVERMALVLQASLLLRHAPADVADAFVAGRLSDEAGRAFGTLPVGADLASVIRRAWPLEPPLDVA